MRKDQGNQLILVVEGDKHSVKLTFPVLKGFLGCHPYRIELAETAREVYQVIQTEQDRYGQLPAMIFLDPSVKGLHQHDLFAELRDRFPGVPKVMYASRSTREKHQADVDQGSVLCFLPQPWDGMYQAGLLRKTLGMDPNYNR